MSENQSKTPFHKRKSVVQVEESLELAPKFNEDGLMPVITTDYASGHVLMQGYMNHEALVKTIETGLAHYWSRSRQTLWRKGETSGLIQHVKQMLIDDDQDSVWLRVTVDGEASCHVGYRSCFYREIPVGQKASDVRLRQIEQEKKFDPEEIYKDQPNPTLL